MPKLTPTVLVPPSRNLPSTSTAQQTSTSATASNAPVVTHASSGDFPTDPHQMDIICPFWNAMVARGYVKMNADGQIDLKTVPSGAREGIDASIPMALTLVPIAMAANKPGDIFHNITHMTFNALDLREGSASHAADMGILRKGAFDEEAFDAVVSHAQGGRMTLDSFAATVDADMKRDAGKGADAVNKGRIFAEAEASLLLTVFGHTDPSSGERYVTVDALRALFQGKELPGAANEKSGIIDLLKVRSSMHSKVDALLAADSLTSTATATGLAQAGANLSEGKKADATDLAKGASNSAGKAANCPFLNGALPAPTQPQQTVNLHTQD